MKKKTKLMNALAFVLTFVIGLLIGLFVDYPQVNDSEFAGTIGKVNNYRNVKATEADIKLKNDLVANKEMQKSMDNYLTFYYTQSVEFGKTIEFAVEQAKAVEPFNANYESQISAVENYGKFLEETRKELLLSSKVCNSLDVSSPLMMRNAIARANNIISQMSYRNSTLINFIDTLGAFIEVSGASSYPGLNKAHSLLLYNQVGTSLATNNKALLKYFDKKKLYTSNIESPTTNIKEVVFKDIEELNLILIAADREKLGVIFSDQEKLSMMSNDQEMLGTIIWPRCLFNDAEKLGSVFQFDTERLGLINDAEKLGTGFSDTEKLGRIMDSEKLGLVIMFDAENLGRFKINDAEKLGSLFPDTEKLGIFFDSENLGLI